MATWPKGVHGISSIMPKYPTMGGFFCHVFMGEKNIKLKFLEISNTTKNLINIKVMALKYTFNLMVQNRLKLKLSSSSVKERV